MSQDKDNEPVTAIPQDTLDAYRRKLNLNMLAAVVQSMAETHTTLHAMATSMGVSQPNLADWFVQVLSGKTDSTLETFADVFRVMRVDIQLGIVPLVKSQMEDG